MYTEGKKEGNPIVETRGRYENRDRMGKSKNTSSSVLLDPTLHSQSIGDSK
jgi:hypothetical protein